MSIVLSLLELFIQRITKTASTSDTANIPAVIRLNALGKVVRVVEYVSEYSGAEPRPDKASMKLVML